MKKRIQRQEVIRDIVRRERIRTQHEIVEFLQEHGFKCTQATISRDIEELKLTKSTGGHYVLAEDQHLQRMVHDLVEKVDRAGNMVVVHAQGGTAAGVAAAIDQANLNGILGTVSGDTTLLCVCSDEEKAIMVEEELLYFMGSIRKS
ncbi:MAG: arginine repressor [Coriobacteriia bacterium]|nr:arginine repressor [Coriobacteriia bacterium]MCL2746753.1 arginine repressor [Coriobacteriia bacterium]MCL2870029.1 arginine repressor [Coriobacteriia bacterium]